MANTKRGYQGKVEHGSGGMENCFGDRWPDQKGGYAQRSAPHRRQHSRGSGKEGTTSARGGSMSY